MMNYTCFSTTDPHFENVTHVFNDLKDTDSLWRGTPSSIKMCSSTSSPTSSGCLPCIQNETLHLICKKIPESEKVKLVMEAVGENIIDINKADHRCPTFLEPGFSGLEVLKSVEETGDGSWGWLIGTIIIIIIISSIIVFVVFKRKPILAFGRRFFRRANPAGTKDGSMGDVSVSIPMNEDSKV